jgi:hypothetical protein
MASVGRARETDGRRARGQLPVPAEGGRLAGYVAAAIRFTSTDSPQPAPQRLVRDRIYWICAIVILASAVAAVVTNFLPVSLRPSFPYLFLYEAVGILAFGVSWFVDDQTLSAMGQWAGD